MQSCNVCTLLPRYNTSPTPLLRIVSDRIYITGNYFPVKIDSYFVRCFYRVALLVLFCESSFECKKLEPPCYIALTVQTQYLSGSTHSLCLALESLLPPITSLFYRVLVADLVLFSLLAAICSVNPSFEKVRDKSAIYFISQSSTI